MEATKVSEPEEQNEPRCWKNKPEIAAHFQCDERTISNWMRRRILPFVKVRGVLRFDVNECDRAFRQFQTKSRFTDSKPPPQTSLPTARHTPPPPPDQMPESGAATEIPCRVFGSVNELRAFLDQLEAEPAYRHPRHFAMLVLQPNARPA